eukprot:941558-Amphidinium_carterae.1
MPVAPQTITAGIPANVPISIAISESCRVASNKRFSSSSLSSSLVRGSLKKPSSSLSLSSRGVCDTKESQPTKMLASHLEKDHSTPS